MEEALRATSADTLKRITESLAKEMEEKKRQKRLQEEAEEDDEVRRRQVRSAERHQVINVRRNKLFYFYILMTVVTVNFLKCKCFSVLFNYISVVVGDVG